MNILVCDDDQAIVDAIEIYLSQEGYTVLKAYDGLEAIRMVKEKEIQLVILDIMMPRMDGIRATMKIREISAVPIIFLSAKSEDVDKILGLNVGADDYITKPFSPKELVARIKAVMRRISPMAVEEVIEMQGLSLDPTSHRVMAGEEPLEMGPTEFKLLHFFMTHPERVYSREQLLNHVWGTNVYVEDRTVDVHIRRLRKALEPGGHDRMVQTVRGTGYRFSTRF